MEFTNEIFFNKPLTAGSTVIITYCGKLYREHSKDVSIVYGYGDNWAETDNSIMIEKENGFEVTLTIKDYNTFNFCFTNSFNIWDNNSGFNYIAPIGPKQDSQEETKIENSNIEEEQITEEDNQENTQEQAQAESEAENTAEFEINNQENIETAFASLLDSILDGTDDENETIDISNLSGFGLQSIDEIKEEDMINCDEIFAELFEELTFDEKNENVSTIETQSNSDEQKAEVQEAAVTDYEKYDAQELDSLMDNLLTSITDNQTTSDYTAPIKTIESQDLSNEKVGLPATQDDKEDWVDKFINISYDFSKKITTAFKKFGTLIKLKAQELGILHNDK